MNWHLFTAIATLTGGRYFVIAGIAFLVFYVLFRSRLASRIIQDRPAQTKDYYREIVYSISTILIFAAVPTFIYSNPALRSHITFYTDIERYGSIYFWAAFPLMAIMHDTY